MTTRERRGVFGEVADDYDRIRPGYPDRLIDDVLAAAGPGPVLEVGGGHRQGHREQRAGLAGFPELGAFDDEWPMLGLRPEQFPERNHRRYHSKRSYGAADYRELLLSMSMYRILDPAAAEAAVADTAAVIDQHGGVIAFDIITDVVLARRSCDSQ